MLCMWFVDHNTSLQHAGRRGIRGCIAALDVELRVGHGHREWAACELLEARRELVVGKLCEVGGCHASMNSHHSELFAVLESIEAHLQILDRWRR